MKQDVLEPFKQHLYQNLTPNTARKYDAAMTKLLKDRQFEEIEELTPEWLEEAIARVTTKNEFSAAKNAMKHLKQVYPQLPIPEEEIFRSMSLKKRNRSRKASKKIYLDEVSRKVNQIRNEKLRYAFRLALVSGLRVSELAAVEGEDITFRDDGTLMVRVRQGKGGKQGEVECKRDEYLYERFKAYTAEHPEGKLFYSEVYMREKAHALGLECHDFRRIFAITTRNEAKKSMPVEEANRLTMEKLRHERFSTTKRYLFNRKLVIKENKEE